MARLPRVIQKIFAKDSGVNDVIEFGTADSTPNATKDISVIQSSDYESGWTQATLGGDRIPTYQDFNAIGKVATEQLAYIFQEGIPEYDASTTYYQGGLVKRGGTSEIYVSRTDDNTGNALTTGDTNANWQYVGNAETLFAGDTTYVEASGSAADAYIVERPEINGVPVSGQPLQYFTGMQVEFFATAANTGASTIDVEGLGAKSIVQDDGSALTAGFIQADSVVRLYYDGTNFILSEINPFDQSLNTTDDVAFTSVDTGHGANDLYAMDQNVRTTDDVAFNSISFDGGINALQEYEVGSWTPSFSNVAASYNSQGGRYVRTGNIVYWTIFLDISSLDTTSTSDFDIGNFPFEQTQAGRGIVTLSWLLSTLINASSGDAVYPCHNDTSILSIQLVDADRSEYRYNSIFNSSGFISMAGTYEAQ